MWIWVHILGDYASKILRAKNVQNLAQFHTTLDFNREYFQKGWTYEQEENGVINYNPSNV